MKPPLPYSSVLVTGADGFVGRNLVPVLQRRLRPAARLALSTREPFAPYGQTEPLGLDLRDPASIRAAVAERRPDLVIHLAAQSSIGQSAELAAESWEINAFGTFHLARAIAASAPEATMMFISSAEVYGRTFNLETATERSELRPQSVYARSKAAAEALLADILPPTARLIVARPSNHSGPGQDSRFVLPSFAEQIAQIEAGHSEPVLRVGNLGAERDFMDVRDVIRAYERLLDAALNLPERSTFNIASGRPLPIRHFLDRLLALSETPIEVAVDPSRMRPSEVPRAALDASAIRDVTGWVPVLSVDEMLDTLLQDQRSRVRSAGR